MHPTPSIAETDTPATSQTGCSQVQYTRTPTTKANQTQTVLTTAPPFSRVLAFALYRNGLEPSTRYQISPANARSLTQRHKYRLPAACRVPLQQKHRRVQVQPHFYQVQNSTSWNCISRHREGWPLPHGIRRYSPQAQSRRPASPTARIWGSTAALKRAALTANPPPVHCISCCPSPFSCCALLCASPPLLLLLWPFVSVLLHCIPIIGCLCPIELPGQSIAFELRISCFSQTSRSRQLLVRETRRRIHIVYKRRISASQTRQEEKEINRVSQGRAATPALSSLSSNIPLLL